MESGNANPNNPKPKGYKMQNKFSRNDENQNAFRVWLDSIPAAEKLAFAADYENGVLDVVAVLENGGQAAGWLDSFVDQVLDFADEFSGVATVRRAHNRFTELAADGMAENDALRIAAAQFGIKPAAIIDYIRGEND